MAEQQPTGCIWEACSALGVHACLIAKSCSVLLRPHGLKPTRLLCPWNFPGKNMGVGCHFLLQGVLLTHGLNLCLLHWQAASLSLSQQGRPSEGSVCHFPPLKSGKDKTHKNS